MSATLGAERPLGRSAITIPRIALGCGNFGGIGSAPEFLGGGLTQDQALALMDAAWQAGITHFDTADAYGGGRSEQAIDGWIASRGVRPQLTTKTFNPMQAGADHGLKPERIARQVRTSLERLGVDRVDLYLAHDFDPDLPLPESLGAFDDAQAGGLIRAYGVSNFDAPQLKASLAAGAPQAIQNSYSLLAREDETELLPLCAERQGGGGGGGGVRLLPVLVLSRGAVRAPPPPQACAEAMAAVLAEHAGGGSFMPLRSVMMPPDAAGFMGLMPGWRGLRPGGAAAFGLKAVCIVPGNPARGLDAHQGLVTLFDGQTGQPTAMLDASAITEVPTAPVTAVATWALSRPEARMLAILGAGTQARAHLAALLPVRDFEQVRVYAPTEAHARALVGQAGDAGAELIVAPSAEDAVRGADVVVTPTTSRDPS